MCIWTCQPHVEGASAGIVYFEQLIFFVSVLTATGPTEDWILWFECHKKNWLLNSRFDLFLTCLQFSISIMHHHHHASLLKLSTKQVSVSGLGVLCKDNEEDQFWYQKKEPESDANVKKEFSECKGKHNSGSPTGERRQCALGGRGESAARGLTCNLHFDEANHESGSLV